VSGGGRWTDSKDAVDSAGSTSSQASTSWNIDVFVDVIKELVCGFRWTVIAAVSDLLNKLWSICCLLCPCPVVGRTLNGAVTTHLSVFLSHDVAQHSLAALGETLMGSQQVTSGVCTVVLHHLRDMLPLGAISFCHCPGNTSFTLLYTDIHIFTQQYIDSSVQVL